MNHLKDFEKLVIKHGITNEDLVILYESYNGFLNLKGGFLGFGKPKNTFQPKLIEIKDKYDLSNIDLGHLFMYLNPKDKKGKHLSPITKENIETYFLSEREKEGRVISEQNQGIVWEKLDILKGQFRALSDIEIPKSTTFKALIAEKEEDIIGLGNDEKLFEFLKIDAFLNDFRNNIAANVKGVLEFVNSPEFVEIEYIIIETERKKRGDFTAEEREYNSSSAGKSNKLIDMMEGNWESEEKKLAKFYGVADRLQATVESAVLTFNLYESYAISCVVFFLNKKRINYFEIHSAFEKLGVFDSTWEKSVKTKLEGIEARLDLINNQLVNLNAEFTNLIESNERTSELISEGLKEIKSSVDANTVVNAFTAYQMYKVNKNTKSLRE